MNVKPFVLLVALTAVSGCGDALVGGVCAHGYRASDGVCLPIEPKIAGGTVTGGGGEAGSGFSGSGGEGAVGEGGTAGSAGAEVGGFGGQPIQCEQPLVACNGSCVDPTGDPDNCGGCGIACPTAICQQGHCVGSAVGHVVVAGMDYRTGAFGAPPSVLLGNAVFLGWHEPVRIVDYTEFSAEGTNLPSTAVILALLDDEASKRGRTFSFTTCRRSADLPELLGSGDFDVLLIEHQISAPPDALGAIGAAWAPAIDEFGKKGGSIVALASASGAGGMDQLLTKSELLDVSDLSSVDGETLENQGMLDAIGVNVLSPFLAKQHSAAIATSEVAGPRLDYVIVTDQGAPVVIHKLIVAD